MEKLLNTELIGSRFNTDTEFRAALVIVHGLGEHQGRYEAAAKRFTQSGFGVFTFDLRGHGRLLASRTKRQRFSNFTSDLTSLIEAIPDHFPGRPIFLWGHSMGSIVALDFAWRSPGHVAGCISTGCPLKSMPQVAQTLGRFGSAITSVVPGWSLNAGLEPELLSHDEAVQSAYAKDPLVSSKLTVNLAFEFGRTIQEVEDHASEIKTPWLAIHGSEDEIAPVEGSRKLIDILGSEDKRLVIIEGSRHEVHNEIPEYRDQFFNLVTEWMDNRLRAPAQAPAFHAQPKEF